MPKFFSMCVAGLLAAALLTGCTSPGPVATPTPTPTPVLPPTPAGPPSLSDDELYALAVSQYMKLDAIIIEVDRQGGATVLPDASHDVMMDPAWSAYNNLYIQGLLSGDRFVGTPKYTITNVARLDGGSLPSKTLIALQTCELFEGAARIDRDGNLIQDGSPVLQHIKAYLRYDDDKQLKVFILNSEGVDTCPF